MDAPQEEVGEQGEEGGVEPVDRRQIGQEGKSHPCKTQGTQAGKYRDTLEVELVVISKTQNPSQLGISITCRALLELAKCCSPLDTQRVTLLTLWHLDCPRTEPAQDVGQDVILDFVLGEPRQDWEQAEEGELEAGSRTSRREIKKIKANK